MENQELDLPRAWEQLPIERLRGTLLIVGAPDAGKSTFVRYAYRRLCGAGVRTAYLDGDPGQTLLGPPGTITVALGEPGSAHFPPAEPVWRWFVGAVSPQRHMLPVVVGGARLVQAAVAAGAQAVLYDTSGLVMPAVGGPALKQAQIDLLRPAAVLGIQRGSELEALLLPWRRSRRVRVIDLPGSRLARRRDVPARQAHRAAQFRCYLKHARALDVEWRRLAVLPAPRFVPQQLVALEDAAGFTIGLGIVLGCDVQRRQVRLLTPLADLERVDALHLGDLLVDPETFRDRPMDE